jgi:hypothetical protein
VVVAGCTAEAAECPLADWLSADVLEQEPALKALLKTAGAAAFHEVRFYSADGRQTASHSGRKTLGYLLPAGSLVTALAAAAKSAGAVFADPCPLASVRLSEDVAIFPGPPAAAAKVLLIACSRPAEIYSQLGLSGRNVPRGVLMATAIDAAWPASKVEKHLGAAVHVVHLAHGDLALAFGVGSTVHLRLIQPLEMRLDTAALAAALPQMLQAAGVLPDEFALSHPKVACWIPPDAVALDLEDHVAKRTLLVGTAGGFADRVTAQTLWPTIRSAVLAADVVGAALKARDIQAALNTFNTVWRRELADALRPPHTAIGMLFPLLFSNRQMVARFAGAMLSGRAL